MCGIVGAVAQRDVADILLEGLKRLEYRGYDSAGLAIISPDSQLLRQRRLGKVQALADAVAQQPMAGGYDTSLNPFVRYRSRLYSHRVAMARGMDDSIYVAMVNEIDNALVEIDGTGFYETPLRW